MQRLSSKNPRVAEIRALARQRRARAESGRFLVEGLKLIGEALDAGVVLDAVYVDADVGWDFDAVQTLVDRLFAANIDVYEIEHSVFTKFGASTSPQPIVAVAQRVDRDLADVPADASLVVVAFDINDPGNMGTIMRTAVAMGADAIVSLGNSVDVYSPKTVRSSAGALFHVPVITHTDAADGLFALGAAGFIRLGLVMGAEQSLPATDMTRRVAVVMGNEAHGLPNTIAELIDEHVAIPMIGPTESLNVAMAATIVLYESLRQRLDQ